MSRVNFQVENRYFTLAFKTMHVRENFVHSVMWTLLQDNRRISNCVWNKEEINGHSDIYTRVRLYTRVVLFINRGLWKLIVESNRCC